MDTSDGARIVDVLSEGIAHEAKVGRVAYSTRVIRQIEKDAELVRRRIGEVSGAHWHFFTSDVTGLVSADERILNLLTKHGIPYTIY